FLGRKYRFKRVSLSKIVLNTHTWPLRIRIKYKRIKLSIPWKIYRRRRRIKIRKFIKKIFKGLRGLRYFFRFNERSYFDLLHNINSKTDFLFLDFTSDYYFYANIGIISFFKFIIILIIRSGGLFGRKFLSYSFFRRYVKLRKKHYMYK